MCESGVSIGLTLCMCDGSALAAPYIRHVLPNSPAALTHALSPGDQILCVNGQCVARFGSCIAATRVTSV